MCDVDFNECVIQEFQNIVNGIGDEDFYNSLKCKEANVDWMKILNMLKADILTELTEIWNMMWSEENLQQKLDLLDQIKKASSGRTKPAWRPKLADIEPQIENLELHNETVMKEYYAAWSTQCERNIAELKTELSDEWEKLAALRNRTEEVRKRNILLCNSLQENKGRIFF